MVIYGFRHFFASNCLSNGIPITDVAEWMGHRSIDGPSACPRGCRGDTALGALGVLLSGLSPRVRGRPGPWSPPPPSTAYRRCRTPTDQQRRPVSTSRPHPEQWNLAPTRRDSRATGMPAASPNSRNGPSSEPTDRHETSRPARAARHSTRTRSLAGQRRHRKLEQRPEPRVGLSNRRDRVARHRDR